MNDQATPSAVLERLELVLHRMEKVEEALAALVRQRTVKDWYTTEEVAELLGKAEFTVREWCRLGRMAGEKRQSGRGAHPQWVISHSEVLRYQHEGLRPPSRRS